MTVLVSCRCCGWFNRTTEARSEKDLLKHFENAPWCQNWYEQDEIRKKWVEDALKRKRGKQKRLP